MTPQIMNPRADINAEWRFTDRLSVVAIGQNLRRRGTSEFAAAGSFLLMAQVPRSGSLRQRWTF